MRWPGRVHAIEDIKISDGDTVLSSTYVDSLISFVNRDKIERDFIPLTEILNDLRITPAKIKCYDILEPIESKSMGTI